MKSTVHRRTGIAEELFGQVRSAVLAMLFFHSDESYYLRQLVRMTGAGHGAVQRELAHLVKLDLIRSCRRGREVFYQVNKSSPTFPDIRGLILKTAGAVDVLRAELASLADRIDVAFIYGSLARGSEKAESDVDVLVIGDVGFGEIVDALYHAQEQLHREVNPSVFTLPEIRQCMTEQHHFITSVLHEEKVFLIGGEHDLARLATE
jgi:predicted nucleotidyltransferase